MVKMMQGNNHMNGKIIYGTLILLKDVGYLYKKI